MLTNYCEIFQMHKKWAICDTNPIQTKMVFNLIVIMCAMTQ